MPLNPDFLGRSYPPAGPYQVTRGKIAEFADAIGDPARAYREPGAARALGHPDVVAPPTFLVGMTAPIADQALRDPELGVDWDRVVHLDQTFDLARPVHAGEELLGVLTVTAVRRLGRHEVVTTEVEVATGGGERVATVSASLLVRGGS